MLFNPLATAQSLFEAFQGEDDPSHVAAGFDHNCSLCHSTTSWAGATFTAHDTLYFPIYTGNHAGRWSSCTDCHTTPSDYGAYTCINAGCHADADTRHAGVANYGHDCIRCHPTGSTGGRFRR